jgi:hypothetical protein
MATYQANITKNIEPAMANPATLQQAGASTRAAIQTLGEGASALYKGYVEQEIATIEQGMQTQAQEFYISRQAAQQAGAQAQQLEQQRPMAGGMFAEAMLGAQGEEKQQQAVEVLKSFDDKILRLKNASEGGMSPEKFQANIQSELKKAIARYPGMADEIRRRTANVTGVDLATQAFVTSYIKGVFSPEKQPKQASPEDMAMKDIDDAAKTGLFGTREELLSDYRTNRAKYDVKMTGFKQVLVTQTQANNVKNYVAGLQGQNDLQADQQQQSFSAIFAGTLGTTVLTTSISDKENTFANTLALMAKGDPAVADPVKFQTLVSLHNSQMKTSIESSRTQAYRSIQTYIDNNPNLSEDKKKQLFANIDRQAEQALKSYADDKGIGLLAMANIMKTYRDKNLTEQQQLVDLAIRQQTAMANTPLGQAYWAGGESRENLKRTQPYFYNSMVIQEKEIVDAISGLRSSLKGAKDLSVIERTLKNGENSGSAQKPDPIAEPSAIKAAHEVLHANAVASLGKTSLLPAEVNIVSSAFSTNVATGANSKALATGYRKYGEVIAKLPEPDQAIIKANVSTSVVGAVTSMQSLKQGIEAKYNTKLTLGVNDAGEISVVMPKPEVSLQNRPLMTAGTTFNPAAAQEFMKQAMPILNNMVYGTSMLTQKDAKVLGGEFANVINNNQPYTGFYSLEAKPVATTPAQPTATAPATTGKRTANMADVAKFAKANNMSVDDAVAKLEADGVDVVGN